MSTRVIKIGYMDGQKIYYSSAKSHLERFLKSFGRTEFCMVKSIEDIELKDCDLLLTTADHVEEDSFLNWLHNLENRIKANHLVFVPAIILADISQGTQLDVMHSSTKGSWYFDIVKPSHLDSIPIRVANLLRIHDHLKELFHYDRETQSLERRVSELEQLLKQDQKSI